MKPPERGELWHAYFPPMGTAAGHHTTTTIVSVIQNDRHRYGKTVLCVPLTTNRDRERPFGILIQRDTRNKLAQDSVAMPWLALAVDIGHLKDRIGLVQQTDLDRIVETLNLLIGN